MAITIPSRNAEDHEFELFCCMHCSLLSGGQTRDVYEIPADANGHGEHKVLKVAKVDHTYNWNEVVLSEHFNTDNAFGKVWSWSRSGKYIVMEWLDNTTEDKSGSFPWPSVVTDRKGSSLGRRPDGTIAVRDGGLLKNTPITRDWNGAPKSLGATYDEPCDGYEDEGVKEGRGWTIG